MSKVKLLYPDLYHDSSETGQNRISLLLFFLEYCLTMPNVEDYFIISPRKCPMPKMMRQCLSSEHTTNNLMKVWYSKL